MSEPVNFYERIPKELRKHVHNPKFSKHGIVMPCRMAIIGGSGSGKTNTLLNFLKDTSGTFEKVIVSLKSQHEPLYQFLLKKLPNSVTIYENSIAPMSELESYSSSLYVFDDLVATKSLQAQISDYFIRGRKFNISCIYISQSYYGIPKLIRLQCQYVILKKLSSDRDLRLLLREYGFNVDFDQMMKIYKDATKNKNDFLMIDLEADNDKKFRHNYKVINFKKPPQTRSQGWYDD